MVWPAVASRFGIGVIPDIQVELDRELLLPGIDSQLQAAIQAIDKQGAE